MKTEPKITLSDIMDAIYNGMDTDNLRNLIEDYGQQKYELGCSDEADAWASNSAEEY